MVSTVVEPTPPRNHLLALGVGALLAVAVAGLLVSVSPRSAPTAQIAATTVPPVMRATQSELVAPETAQPDEPTASSVAVVDIATTLQAGFATFTTPERRPQRVPVPAPTEPHLFERVLLVTDVGMVATTWMDIVLHGDMIDGVVVNMRGEIVALCEGDELHLVVGQQKVRIDLGLFADD